MSLFLCGRSKGRKNRVMGYYPIFIDMTARRCAVVGGGEVAERKIEALISAGASVTVISPSLTKTLTSWVADGKIACVARKYRPGDLNGFEIALVATDDAEVTSVVAREGRERRIWVNAADDPAHCDFILPSVLRRGDLCVAVGTGGNSPAMSKVIREELEGYFTPDYADLTQVAAEVRRDLKQEGWNPSAVNWQEGLGNDFRRLIAEGKREEAKVHLIKCLRNGHGHR